MCGNSYKGGILVYRTNDLYDNNILTTKHGPMIKSCLLIKVFKDCDYFKFLSFLAYTNLH